MKEPIKPILMCNIIFPKHRESSDIMKKPIYTLEEWLQIISATEEKDTLQAICGVWEEEKVAYHSEQALLIQAHLKGRIQYLQLKNG